MAPSDIMIVDDNPANLKLLEDMLQQQGHEVRSFPLGRLALGSAMKTPPDLILLDINMPEMNGYEVCERLKSTGELSGIPVIFLSARNETADKVKAFHSGAVDYISKPFQFEEVHARVETHLELHSLQRGLKQQNERLEAAVEMRTRELAEANQQLTILDRSKNDFLRLISHEFRTPLHGLLGVGEMILDDMSSTERSNDLRQIFDHSRQRILSILDDSLLLTEIDVEPERFGSAAVSLGVIVNQAIQSATEFAKSRYVTLAHPSSAPHFVFGGEDCLVKAMQALLETAVKFSEVEEAVKVRYEVGSDSLRVIIDTRGRAIPDSALPRFFDLFSVGEAITPGGDLGLGPAVARRILSLFGASVSAVNLDPPGIRLTISLRQAPLPKLDLSARPN